MADLIPPDDVDHPMDALVAGLPASAPPPDFAAGVVAAQARHRRRGRVLGAVTGGLALSAALLAAVLVLRPASSSGEVIAAVRESVSLGERAVAVLEPAARVRYDVDAGRLRDHVTVDQSAGRAFYRVEKGTPLVVKTPAGDVVVHGTCFSVDVSSPKLPKDPAMALALSQKAPSVAAGALMGVLLSVTVFEGAVQVHNGRGDVAVGPGQTASARADETPTVAVTAAADPGLLKRLRRQNEDLQASLDNARAASGGDVQRILAENQALRDKLRHDDEELALVDADRKDKEGEALPFPADLPPRFTQAELLKSYTAALKEAGVDGDVTHIDCSEYPCIVYGDVKLPKEGDARSLAQKLEATAALQAYKNDADNSSWWRSLAKDKDTGEDVDETHFGVALWPKAADGQHSDADSAIGKRIGFRNQQMWDQTKPAH